eukprot:TRINITY_DN924_c0_g2_i1.p1 TRINITY_DN924_c0_g2~~TRINITY_DN924_c0_g2_i1.p1  ORF type:complete len:131 (-),score=18.12 TRINITY_DN924_c0_g2_i1:586-978(-)
MAPIHLQSEPQMPELLQPLSGAEGKWNRYIQLPMEQGLVCLPSIQPDWMDPEESVIGEDRNHSGNSTLALSNVVAATTHMVEGSPLNLGPPIVPTNTVPNWTLQCWKVLQIDPSEDYCSGCQTSSISSPK